MKKIDKIDFADEANLEIKSSNATLHLRHKLNLKANAVTGLIVLFSGGLFLAIIPFIKSTDTGSKFLGLLIGLSISIFSILSFIRDQVGFVEIKSREVTFRYNLRLTKIPITGTTKIKTDTEIISIRRVGTLGSDFIKTTFYLLDNDNEHPIFAFQTKKADEEKTKKLSVAISNLLNEKIHLRTII